MLRNGDKVLIAKPDGRCNYGIVVNNEPNKFGCVMVRELLHAKGTYSAHRQHPISPNRLTKQSDYGIVYEIINSHPELNDFKRGMYVVIKPHKCRNKKYMHKIGKVLGKADGERITILMEMGTHSIYELIPYKNLCIVSVNRNIVDNPNRSFKRARR